MQNRSGPAPVLLEALGIAVLGLALALVANALSPRGLKLSRNYSPGSALAAVQATGTNGQNTSQLLEKQFAAEGLQLADSNQVVQLFNDPARQQGLIVFIDARDDQHYQAGHIPGAFQLDHFHPEAYLATVLPACQVAQKIVVYCKGGSCEDSEQTAIFLRDAAIPREKLFVYAGGFDEWTANHLPTEFGERNSGRVENTSSSTGEAGAK